MAKITPHLADVSPSSFKAWLDLKIESGGPPARVIRPSRYSITGYVPTTKGRTAQSAESMLEQDFLALLEFDPRVESYLAQPFTIKWQDDLGRSRVYTPDVIVKYTSQALISDPYLRPTLFEVKPQKVLKETWMELKPKFRATLGWAKLYGCRFHIATERIIRTPYLINARFLQSFIDLEMKVSNQIVVKNYHVLAKQLLECSNTTPAKLLEMLTQDRWLQAELIPWLWVLVIKGGIGVDLQLPLTMNSDIWPTLSTARFAQGSPWP